ncbi:hypothetical protein AcW1_004099 [Taiwanofungus camphoratus]|nr:hypothetical protein AcW1_004099 [Antrodia cinnamomea]
MPPQSRQYSLSLCPSIIPSTGPLIDALIASGVSRYGGFKLLERVAIYDRPGLIKAVPGSKEDVFKSKELSLIDKRRLMRFLVFAAGDFEEKKELQGKEHSPFISFLKETFSLDDRATCAIAFALAFCISASDTTLPALQRIRRYLRSAGRYGASPFLVGHYGGLGEIAQGFCRISAVNGAIYILGRQISFALPMEHRLQSSCTQVPARDNNPTSSLQGPRAIKLALKELPEELSCDVVVSTPDYILPELRARTAVIENSSSLANMSHGYSIARCIAIIDRPLSFSASEQETESSARLLPEHNILVGPEDQPRADANTSEHVDTALLVFPPAILPDGSPSVAVNVLIMGEGSMSTPKGKWVLYISMPLPDASMQTTEELLRPYLDATLSLADTQQTDEAPIEPLFSLFYTEHPSAPIAQDNAVDSPSSVLVTPARSPVLPELADAATSMAEKMFRKAVEVLQSAGRRPRAEGSEVEDVEVEVESFWPPLDIVDDGEDW